MRVGLRGDPSLLDRLPHSHPTRSRLPFGGESAHFGCGPSCETVSLERSKGELASHPLHQHAPMLLANDGGRLSRIRHLRHNGSARDASGHDQE
jgi:hypothetical protein